MILYTCPYLYKLFRSWAIKGDNDFLKGLTIKENIMSTNRGLIFAYEVTLYRLKWNENITLVSLILGWDGGQFLP